VASLTPAQSVFTSLTLPVLRRLEKEGFLEASPIQELAIPAILKGGNILLIAPTGTGKTLAAVLPVLDQFLQARSEQPGASAQGYRSCMLLRFGH